MGSLIPPNRLAFLAEQGDLLQYMDGDVAEVGVYKGGSAKVLSDAMPGKTLHLFDTFTGLPEPSEFDQMEAGKFSDTSEEDVRRFLQARKVKLYPGLFPDTVTPELEALEFCLVHIDVDLYQSTKDALEFFWPRLVIGGRVILDDYNHPRCQGVNKAADEFFRHLAVAFVSLGKDGQAGTKVTKWSRRTG